MSAPETAIAERQKTKPKRKIATILDVQERQTKVDLSKALLLRLKHGHSYSEIAQTFGCTKQAVEQRLKGFLPFLRDPEEIDQYETHKAAMLSAAELRLLRATLDERKIKDASINNIAYAFQQVSNFNRLARGESTANVNLQALTGDLKSIQETRDRLANELRSIQSNTDVVPSTVDSADDTEHAP